MTKEKALERKAENARELGLDYEPLEAKDGTWSGVDFDIKTTPPQRTWIGLTDEEIEQGCKESWITEQAFQSAVWWAEAKLKEKNT